MPHSVRRTRIRRAATAVIVGGVIAGVGFALAALMQSRSHHTPPPSKDEDRRAIMVTRDDPSLPKNCGVRETARYVSSFTEGLSNGDLALLDRVFSEKDELRFVTIGDPHGLTGEASVNRAAVMRYLESRVERGESMRLTNVLVETVTEYGDPERFGQAVRVHLLVMRRANDISGVLPFRGWAEVTCPEGEIRLMDIGRLHPSEDVGSWCSAAGFDGDATIACASEERRPRSLIFPVLDFNFGEEAGLGGRLVRRGRCLYVQSGSSGALTFPMWPPGFTSEPNDGGVTVRDEHGIPVARTGSRVVMAGGYHGGTGGYPPSEFEDEWKSCAPSAAAYFAVSDVIDGSQQHQQMNETVHTSLVGSSAS